MRSVMAASRKIWGGIHRCTTASALASTKGQLPCAIRYRAARRRYSHWREAATMGRSCTSRPGNITGETPSSTCRSAAIRRHSASSAHNISSGRCSCWAAAAASWARCTGETPVTRAGPSLFCRCVISSCSSFIFKSSCSRPFICRTPPFSTRYCPPHRKWGRV